MGPEFCEECFEAKEALCPKCREQIICGSCEETCMRCYLWPDDGEDDLRPEDYEAMAE